MGDDVPFVEKLNAAYRFPCPYTFKLIGDNDDALVDAALAELKAVLPDKTPTVTRRPSAQGNHQSITFVVEVPEAEVVIELYTRFKALKGVKVML